MKVFTLMLFTLLVATFASAQIVSTESIPVRLSSFEADRSGNFNNLNWSVVCFLQYANFEIERSADGINYTTIHSFKADELRCRQPFNYTDANPVEKSFYRIRVGDLDGRFYSSKIVVLYGASKGFDITGINPGIVTGNAILNITSSATDKAETVITSLQGYRMVKKSISLLKGSNTVQLQLAILPAGTYFVSVINSTGQIKTSGFIKQ